MTKAPPLLTKAQFALTAASVTAAVLPHVWRLPGMFGGPILLVLAGRWLHRHFGGARIPIAIKLPLILAFPAIIILHYGNIFGREPGSALACSMLALKLVETDTRRDARAAIAFASFVLMSALLFNSSLGFALLLIAALSLFFAALRELENRDGDAQRALLPALREGLRAGAVSLAAALPLALCVFVFFPRADRCHCTHRSWRSHGTRDDRGTADRRQPGVSRDVRRPAAAARQPVLARAGAVAF